MTSEPAHLPTTEEELANARLLALDAATYGVSYVDVTGKRIDPATIGVPPSEPQAGKTWAPS